MSLWSIKQYKLTMFGTEPLKTNRCCAGFSWGRDHFLWSLDLCFGFVLKTMLIKYRCFWYCWAALTVSKLFCSSSHLTCEETGSSQEVGRTLTPNTSGISQTIQCRDQHTKVRAGGDIWSDSICLPKSPLDIMGPCSLEMAAYPWEAVKTFLILLHFHAQFCFGY